MSSTPDLSPVLRSYFDAINSERYGDVAELFSDDGELAAPGTPPRRGMAEITDYYRAALAPYPEHEDVPTRLLTCGRTATVEIHFSGALASGVGIEFDALDVFDFDEQARIVRLTSWYDSHDVRTRLRAARGARSVAPLIPGGAEPRGASSGDGASGPPNPEATVHAFLGALDAKRYDEVVGLFTDQADLRAPGIPPLLGREELEGYFRTAMRPYDASHTEATRIIVAGSTVTVEVRFVGTLSSGAPLAFDGVDVFDLDDQGSIVSMSSWYDSHDVRARLRTALQPSAAQP
ncbi:MAG TPA: nuclear transport factor 2 family protein [Solirubrobacteraceae bacterium]|jgi:ketosteroid isomerase-like protein|nr:nuclear transport factor 2 family protein [Solirubrobacteraceae bacterium]